MGLRDPLVQLYTGMVDGAGKVEIFQATAHMRLMGISTGTKSATQLRLSQMISITVDYLKLWSLRRLRVCSEYIFSESYRRYLALWVT